MAGTVPTAVRAPIFAALCWLLFFVSAAAAGADAHHHHSDGALNSREDDSSLLVHEATKASRLGTFTAVAVAAVTAVFTGQSSQSSVCALPSLFFLDGGK